MDLTEMERLRRQSAQQAPRPTTNNDFYQVIQELRNAQAPPEGQDEQELLGLSRHPGWRHLKAYAEAEAMRLRTLQDLHMTGSENFQEIGFRVLVANLAAEKMLSLVGLVEAQRDIEESRSTLEDTPSYE